MGLACETWRGSVWFERISESRRPIFESDIDSVPHEIFRWHARRGGGHFGSNVSAKAAVQDSNQIYTTFHTKFKFYHYHDYHYKFAKYVPWISQSGRGQSGLNISAKAAVQDSNQMDNVPHLMFNDYHYNKALEKCCCTYNCLKFVRLFRVSNMRWYLIPYLCTKIQKAFTVAM